jgi:hypothetical protein
LEGCALTKIVGAYGAKTGDKDRARAAIEEIRRARRGHKLGGLKVKEMIEEGRRF